MTCSLFVCLFVCLLDRFPSLFSFVLLSSAPTSSSRIMLQTMGPSMMPAGQRSEVLYVKRSFVSEVQFVCFNFLVFCLVR